MVQTLSPLKLGILGIRGRMGQALYEATQDNAHIKITSGLSRNGDWSLPGVILTKNVEEVFWAADVILDFSHASLTETHIKSAIKAKKSFILGATGFDRTHLTPLFEEAGLALPFLDAPNTSLGNALLARAVRAVGASLQTLTDRQLPHNFDAGVFEMHHRQKQDNPSGTALALGRIIQETGFSQDISYASLRGGGTPGEHQVHFMGSLEDICLTHHLNSRYALAQGAIVAAQTLAHKPKGLYTMDTLLFDADPA